MVCDCVFIRVVERDRHPFLVIFFSTSLLLCMALLSVRDISGVSGHGFCWSSCCLDWVRFGYSGFR